MHWTISNYFTDATRLESDSVMTIQEFRNVAKFAL
jgi:hypothetical protein